MGENVNECSVFHQQRLAASQESNPPSLLLTPEENPTPPVESAPLYRYRSNHLHSHVCEFCLEKFQIKFLVINNLWWENIFDMIEHRNNGWITYEDILCDMLVICCVDSVDAYRTQRQCKMPTAQSATPGVQRRAPDKSQPQRSVNTKERITVCLCVCVCEAHQTIHCSMIPHRR